MFIQLPLKRVLPILTITALCTFFQFLFTIMKITVQNCITEEGRSFTHISASISELETLTAIFQDVVSQPNIHPSLSFTTLQSISVLTLIKGNRKPAHRNRPTMQRMSFFLVAFFCFLQASLVSAVCLFPSFLQASSALLTF